jgi:hypothetical protein
MEFGLLIWLCCRDPRIYWNDLGEGFWRFIVEQSGYFRASPVTNAPPCLAQYQASNDSHELALGIAASLLQALDESSHF